MNIEWEKTSRTGEMRYTLDIEGYNMYIYKKTIWSHTGKHYTYKIRSRDFTLISERDSLKQAKCVAEAYVKEKPWIKDKAERTALKEELEKKNNGKWRKKLN